MAGLSNIEARISRHVADLLLPEVPLQERFRRTKRHDPIHGYLERKYVPSLVSLALRRRLLPVERNIQRLVENPAESGRRIFSVFRVWGSRARQAIRRENIIAAYHAIAGD